MRTGTANIAPSSNRTATKVHRSQSHELGRETSLYALPNLHIHTAWPTEAKLDTAAQFLWLGGRCTGRLARPGGSVTLTEWSTEPVAACVPRELIASAVTCVAQAQIRSDGGHSAVRQSVLRQGLNGTPYQCFGRELDGRRCRAGIVPKDSKVTGLQPHYSTTVPRHNASKPACCLLD